MNVILNKLFQKSEIVETTTKVAQDNSTPPNQGMENLIKMKEAMSLIKASAPTVRKYARMGYYSEYRFGEKLVFYDKQEMLNFIMGSKHAK